MNRNYLMIGACAATALAAFAIYQSDSAQPAAPTSVAASAAMVSVQVPPIEGNAQIGKRIFDTACAACHGANAAGTAGVAPPLVHVIYEPNHHADESFQRAVTNGVRSHHWRFGDMPPVAGLTRGDVTMIVAYIRQLQRANGIH